MKRKTWLIILGIIVLAGVIIQFSYDGGVVGLGMDFGMLVTGGKEHKDPTKEAAAFTVTADDLANEFAANKDAANAKYMDKTILVTGKITDSVQLPTISLGKVVCTIDSAHLEHAASLAAGQDVKIQGQFVGYNDLLEEIDISKCGIK
jgi:hypothetical protein